MEARKQTRWKQETPPERVPRSVRRARAFLDSKPFDWRDLIGTNDLIVRDSPRNAIRSADEVVKDGFTSVVLYLRVSTNKQGKTTLSRQEDQVEEYARDHGLTIVGVVSEIGFADLIDGRPSRDPDGLSSNRTPLREAIDLASQTPKTFVLAWDSSRFLRHPNFVDCRYLEPDGMEWLRLNQLAKDVTLATIVDPEAKHGQLKSEESKRGQSQTGRKGGRPKKRKKRPQRNDDQNQALMSRYDGGNVAEFCNRERISTATFYRVLREQGM